MYTKEARERMRVAKLGNKNPMRRPEVAAKFAASRRRIWAKKSKKEKKAEGERLATAWMRRFQSDPSMREKMSKDMIGTRNPSKKPASRKAISDGQKRAWKDPRIRARRMKAIQKAWDQNWESRLEKVFTEEYSQKMYKTMKGRFMGHRPAGPKKVWYVGLCGRIAMRSKAEVLYAKLLDKSQIKWLYEPCTFFAGKRHGHWTPDFYLPVLRKFVEVKGWLLPRVKEKIMVILRHLSATKFEFVHSESIIRKRLRFVEMVT